MFFCTECDYKYDITKNVEQIDTSKSNNTKNDAYYICNNCGYNNLIEPKTMIYYKTTEKISLVSYKNTDLLYDHTLPVTKNYVCQNNKCTTHTDSNSKEAVFYKHNHIITYICKVCKIDWTI